MKQDDMRLCISIQENQKKIDKFNVLLKKVRPAEISDFFKENKYFILVPKELYEWLKNKT